MRPVIGISCDFSDGNHPPFMGKEPTSFLRLRYVRAIEALGGTPILVPVLNDHSSVRRILDRVDGVVLTGSGPDIDPAHYGERPRFRFRVMRRERTELEFALAREAMRRDRPLFGICGGMQLLNVAFGGSLVQDIGREIGRSVSHRQKGEGNRLSHWIRIHKPSRLFKILRQNRIRTNSFHHQSVRTLAPGFVASASADDGVIEAIEHPDTVFVLGVQWHPEYLYRRQMETRRLLQAFIKSCRLKR